MTTHQSDGIESGKDCGVTCRKLGQSFIFRCSDYCFGSLAMKFEIQQCSDEPMRNPEAVVDAGGSLIEFEQ
ncbi:hypothetical protein AAES_63829 [Amazona aestiva]|uniref:Uncharacterized protein n=1 Tax=Amazona aestiva TaxID=12930 RepID=A0A0Q3UTA6_AMAAE|nr:hypothetical protein AAES_63829 [Amazona aestiva]